MHKAATAKAKDLKSLKRHIASFRTGFQEKYPGFGSDQILILLLLYLAMKYLHIQNPSSKGNYESKNSNFCSANTDGYYAELIYIFEYVSSISPHITKNKITKPEKELFTISLPALMSLDEAVCPFIKNNVSIIGDIYQMWKTTERTISLDSIQKAAKSIEPDELIAFTQIYTPDWIVDFLLSHTLGFKTKNLINSNSLLKNPPRTNTPSQIENLTIIDPACGAGHFLVKSFAHLFSVYRSLGIPKEEAINQILKNQIHGADIDNTALFIVSLILSIICIQSDLSPEFTLSNLCYIDLAETQSLGALTRNYKKHSILDSQYDIVLTNPPYIGRKLMDRELKSALRKEFPDSYYDLSSAFVKRCLEMLAPDGRFGVITQASILTLPTYKKLRKHVINNYNIDRVVDLGPGAFPTQHGEKINSSLIVFSHPGSSNTKEKITFIDLKHDKNKQEVLTLEEENLNKKLETVDIQNGKVFIVSKDTISEIYNYAFNYQIPQVLTESIKECRTLSDQSEVKQGLATTDNKAFVKYIWQVSPEELNHKWYQYAKGAGSNRWFSPIIHVVDWYDNGARIKQRVKEKYPYLKGKVNWVVKNEEFYFKNGLSFSFVSSNGMAVRKLPENCIFDVGASSIFPQDIDHDFLLSYLNSSIINAFISSINPTINFQVGDLKRIPLIKIDTLAQNKLSQLGKECYQVTKQLYNLSDPVSSYISIHKQDTNSTAFFNWLAKSLATNELTLDNCVNRYCTHIKALTEKVLELEKEIDEVVLLEFSKSLKWTSKEQDEIRSWTNKFQKPNNRKTSEDSQVAFESMIVTEKLLFHKAMKTPPVTVSNSESLLPDASLEFLKLYPRKIMKTDFKSFICRSFRRAVPSDLLLEDMEVL